MQRESPSNNRPNTRPNTRFRKLRDGLNQTQQQVAEGVGAYLDHPLDPEYVGRLERGVITWPNDTYRTAFRRYFTVASDADLGFYCTRTNPDPPWDDEDTDPMRRRTAIGTLPLAGASLAGANLAEPLASFVEWATSDEAPVPRRVGSAEVEQIRAAATYGYTTTVRIGGAAVYEMLRAELRWAVRLLDSHVDRWAADDLYSAIGHLARHTAWAAHHAGLDGSASRCCQVALYCADKANNWSLRAKALNAFSRIAEMIGDGDAALTHAQQAMVRPDRLTSLERASITAAEAVACGRLGDLTACRSALGRAEDYLAAAKPADESPAMVAFFCPAELAWVGGLALWPLALRGEAVTASLGGLRTAVTSFTPEHGHARARSQTKLATLLFLHGDPDEATTVAHTALDEARTVRSLWLTADLRALRSATRRHRDHPGIPELRHKLGRTLGQ